MCPNFNCLLTLGGHAQQGLQYLGLFVWVCVSVKSHLTLRMSNQAINKRAYSVAYERPKICGDLPKKTAFESYAAKHEQKSQYANLPAYPWSAFSAQCTAKH